MASCSVCSGPIPAADIVAGKYKKVDGQPVCLTCAQEKTASSAPAKRPQTASAGGPPRRPAQAAGTQVRPASRPPLRKEKPARTAPRPPARRVRHVAPQEEGLDKTVKIALGVAGGVLVMFLVVFFMVSNRLSDEEAARQATLKKSADAVLAVKNYRAQNPDDFDGIIAKIEEVRGDVIPQSPDEFELITITNRTNAERQEKEFLEENQAKLDRLRENADKVEMIEQNLKEINELLVAARGMGTEFLEDATAIGQKIYDNALVLTEKKARDFAEENPNDLKGQLNALATARHAFSGMISQMSLPEMQKKIREKIAILSEEENALAWEYANNSLDSISWTDLLGTARKPLWTSVGPVEFSINDGVMNVASTVGVGAKERGLVLSGTKDKWLDFLLEMDITIEKAGFVLTARYSGPRNFLQRTVETGGEGNPIVDGGRYIIRIKVVGGNNILEAIEVGPDGSHVPIELQGADLVNPPAARNGGAFGFGINPAGKLTIHSMKIKILREDP